MTILYVWRSCRTAAAYIVMTIVIVGYLLFLFVRFSPSLYFQFFYLYFSLPLSSLPFPPATPFPLSQFPTVILLVNFSAVNLLFLFIRLC